MACSVNEFVIISTVEQEDVDAFGYAVVDHKTEMGSTNFKGTQSRRYNTPANIENKQGFMQLKADKLQKALGLIRPSNLILLTKRGSHFTR